MAEEEERVKFGIEGLDGMLHGGILPGTICAIVGTYGTGKTTFAFEFMKQGIENGEACVYISLEEREEDLIKTFSQRNWNFTEYINKKLFVINLDPTDFNLSLHSMKNELPALIKKTEATRVVIDPVSHFEGLFEDTSVRRTEMYKFIHLMGDLKCTLLLTSETDMHNPYSSRYNLVEYLSDTVILLRYVRPDDFSEIHLAVEVVKMRRSSHSRDIKPYEITNDTIEVFSEASVF